MKSSIQCKMIYEDFINKTLFCNCITRMLINYKFSCLGNLSCKFTIVFILFIFTVHLDVPPLNSEHTLLALHYTRKKKKKKN